MEPPFLPPHILEAIEEMKLIDSVHQKQTRESRAAIGAYRYPIKDDESLQKVTVTELADLIAQYWSPMRPRHPSYLNKCAKIYVWLRDGRLKEHDDFCQRTLFAPRNSSEPYASMEIERALTAAEGALKAEQKKQFGSLIGPNEQDVLDYLDDAPAPAPPNINIICGDANREAPKFKPETFDILFGSPAYHGARDYDHPDQMGQEETEELHRAAIVKLVLAALPSVKPTGIVALVVGDRISNGSNPGARGEAGLFSRHPSTPKIKIADTIPAGWPMRFPDLLFEDLIATGCLQPVQKIIWYKLQSAPESVKRRCSRSHEVILVLAKTPNYYWNAEAKTPVMKPPGSDLYQQERGIDCSDRTMKHDRDVWPIPRCRGRTLKHPARFSEELARRALRLMCPPGGHVLDLWGGSGTTAVAALQLGLDCTSVELNPDYVLEQQTRLAGIPQARKWLRPLITPHGRMIHGDALTETRKVGTGEIGFILFDPPSANGATALSWDEDLDWDAIFEELWRVLKIDGFIAVNCNDRLFARLVEMQGPRFRYAIRWFRTRATNIMQTRFQPMRHLENIAIFGRVATGSYTPQMPPIDGSIARSKRSRTINFLGRQVVLPEDGDVTYDAELPIDLRFYDFEPGEKITFPTQKPIAMGVDLIRTYARPGDTFLDICVGSGTNAIAAIRCGYQFIAYERDEKHFQIACDRIRATDCDESDQVVAAD